MDWLVIIFLCFVITVITAALFCGWIIWAIIRFIVGGITRLAGGAPIRPQLAAVRCARIGCAAQNPTSARFCRRCGLTLPAPHPPQQVAVRRAAVW